MDKEAIRISWGWLVAVLSDGKCATEARRVHNQRGGRNGGLNTLRTYCILAKADLPRRLTP